MLGRISKLSSTWQTSFRCIVQRHPVGISDVSLNQSGLLTSLLAATPINSCQEKHRPGRSGDTLNVELVGNLICCLARPDQSELFNPASALGLRGRQRFVSWVPSVFVRQPSPISEMESTGSSAYLLITVLDLKQPKNISLQSCFPNILELGILLSYQSVSPGLAHSGN
jgi:hypothetical protein